MYSYIIFDNDGTLIETSPVYMKLVLEKTLNKFGDYKVSTSDAKQFWFKQSREEFLKEKYNLTDMHGFWEEFIKHDTVKARKEVAKPYEDIFYLNFLKEKYKLKFGILSDAHPEITKMELDLIDKNLFDCIVNSNYKYNGINSKPHIEGALKIISKLKVGDKKGLFVGDSEQDILCARNVTSWGPEVLDILMSRGEHKINIIPTVSIRRLSDLVNILEDAN